MGLKKDKGSQGMCQEFQMLVSSLLWECQSDMKGNSAIFWGFQIILSFLGCKEKWCYLCIKSFFLTFLFFSSKWWFHKIWDILIQIHYETIQFQRPFFLFLYTRTFEDEPYFVVIWVQTIVCLKCMISHLCLSTIQRDPLLHQPSTCDTWTPALATLPTPLCKWQQPERRPWHYTQSGSQRSSWSSGSLPRALTTQSAVLRSAAQQLCRGITDNNFNICALNTALMTIRKTVWQILMK